MRLLILMVWLATSVSCSWLGGNDEEEESLSTEEQFYQIANDQLRAGNYSQAVQTYQQLESRFPFGQFAAQAQLELIYAQYRSGNLEAARAAADRFIRLHPDHNHIDYAYYMKGVASYSQNRSLVSRFLPTDPSKRDISRAQDAFNEFSLLLSLYPGSEYAADARARMIYLRNNLASHEIHVANYYMERRAYIAALNRARYVVENFQGSPRVADGISIMVECYLRLGLDELADTSLALLKENFPDHETIDSNGEFVVRNHVTDPSLLYTVSFGLLGSNTDDTPLAPTRRPQNRTPDVAEPEQERSLLNILTFGLLGEDGSEAPPAPPGESVPSPGPSPGTSTDSQPQPDPQPGPDPDPAPGPGPGPAPGPSPGPSPIPGPGGPGI